MTVKKPPICNIFCRHTADLEAYLLRQTGSSEEAADIAQDVYLRLVQLGDLDRIERPRHYLFQTAVNLLRDRSRRRKARAFEFHVPIEDMELVSPDISADDVLAGKQQLSLFENAMYQLTEKQRQAFLLHRFGERTQAEIAEEMGISLSFVEKLIRSAVAQLKIILGEDNRKAA